MYPGSETWRTIHLVRHDNTPYYHYDRQLGAKPAGIGPKWPSLAYIFAAAREAPHTAGVNGSQGAAQPGPPGKFVT